MQFVKQNIGGRRNMWGLSFLHMPSRVLLTVLSVLFLVSTQLCYAMAHDTPTAGVSVGCRMSEQQSAASAMPASHHGGQQAPMDHGAKAPVACVMMSCGCIVQLSADIGAFAPSQDFGPPPLVAALSSNARHDLLRPPITLPL
ncbi:MULTISPECIES: hypothetical protein [Brucella/Ochrobactrum group]|uniref:DUF2946 domain-containing protein n=1 Tax=Ochrobactrum soli TaxID=2448455 RepID=A0A2P9HGM7_9HYPH|nr:MULTISPECIES: hypothetical protein [Brucella]RRD24573.1 hypothetical protein ECB98_12620 [Brucellaceae bacterium VT-16-1752]WHT43204.1 hypothetical protein QLQ11_14880 [Ochrobactrum sp. SSR]MDX4073390.1 hypothetical protein [Brucella sp. NBRC 113783]WHS33100.1 hypothetical protein QLQ09_22825 [Brucella sp. NM4]SPL63242.1 FIG00450931: hypothetical protein [[Ochrobactrum] soli]